MRALGLIAVGVALVACHRAGTDTADARAPRNLSYADPEPRFALGIPGATQAPIVEGVVDRFAIDPALPDGLSLDPTTGAIAGVARELRAAAIYEVTASNAFGRAVAALRLDVGPPRERLRIVAGRDDDGMTVLLPRDNGQLETLAQLAPTLSEGPSGVAVARDGRFAYAALRRARQLVTYAADPISGSLRAVERRALGFAPKSLTLHPTAPFLYVTGDSVQRFALDPASGRVSDPIEVASAADSLTFVPGARFGYLISDPQRSVQTVVVDPTTGVLVSTGALIDVFSRARRLAVHPNGRLAYLTDWGSGAVLCFAIGEDGGLRRLGSVSTGLQPSTVVVHPGGALAYLVASGSLRVEVFRIPTDGVLERIDAQSLGDVPSRIELAADGRFAWVTFADSGAVVRYAIGASGRLESPRTTGLRGPLGVSAAARDAEGQVRVPRFAYVTSRDDDRLLVHTMRASDGQLERIAELETGRAPWAVALHPSGRAVYVAEYLGNAVREFRVDASGRHTPSPPPDRTEAEPLASGPVDLLVDATGRTLFATFFSSSELVYYDASLGEAGFRRLESLAVAGGPRALAATVDGRFVLVLSEIGRELAIVPASVQDVRVVDRIALTGEPHDVVVSASGSRAYVSDRAFGTIVQVPIDARSGAFGSPLTSASLRGAGDLVAAPDGRHLFAVEEETGAIVAFEIIEPSGGLREVARVQAVGRSLDLALDPQGRFLLAADPAGDPEIEIFAFDAEGQALTAAGSFASRSGSGGTAISGELAPGR